MRACRASAYACLRTRSGSDRGDSDRQSQLTQRTCSTSSEAQHRLLLSSIVPLLPTSGSHLVELPSWANSVILSGQQLFQSWLSRTSLTRQGWSSWWRGKPRIGYLCSSSLLQRSSIVPPRKSCLRASFVRELEGWTCSIIQGENLERVQNSCTSTGFCRFGL